MAWKYFSEDEMRCRCGCGQSRMDGHFMDMLDALRRAVGRPLPINSGYRCQKHDAEENGGGNHTQGRAADIDCPDSSLRFLLISSALQLGFKRIGIAKTFIHVDLCSDKSQQVIWLY